VLADLDRKRRQLRHLVPHRHATRLTLLRGEDVAALAARIGFSAGGGVRAHPLGRLDANRRSQAPLPLDRGSLTGPSAFGYLVPDSKDLSFWEGGLMRFRLLLLVALAVAAASVVTGSAAADPTFSALNPGGPANFSERVPVQFVFLGYEPSQVNQSDFLAELPSKYDAVVRSRGFYPGLPTEYVGLHYTYDFKVAYTDTAYENAFFNKLTSLAVPESTIDGRTRTLFQDQYNAETKNVLDVGTNYFIDAPSVEKWLYQNPPAGVDPNRDTVVFVNWYERPDFKFHTYTKFGEPDPDTGYDFGLNRQSRKIIAWGGTGPNDEETGFGATSRLWFYDLSAGPSRGRTTGTSTMRTWTAMGRRTTACRRRGSTSRTATTSSRNSHATSARSRATTRSTCSSPPRRSIRRTSRRTGSRRRSTST